MHVNADEAEASFTVIMVLLHLKWCQTNEDQFTNSHSFQK